jgi:hypothetical protein
MDCDKLPSAIWLDHDWPRLTFESRLRTLGMADGGWVTISECTDCGQCWRVDRPDKYSVDLAIKVPTPSGWTAADDRNVRIGYLTQSYGGQDSYRCIWAGCSNLALRRVAMCAEHLFDRMGVGAKGG